MVEERLKSNLEFEDLVGQSAEMRTLYRTIPRVASSRHPILLLGESGTGKETVARAIHAHGPFPEGPFVVVDCVSVAPSLLEGGLLVQAAGKPKERLIFVPGTIFLDEVGAMLPDLQAKLVRALQEREIRPSGGAAIPADARVIAASSRDLELAVQQGTFRRDLYSQLSAVRLRLPALRDRKDDIRLLAEHGLESLGAGKGIRHSISHEAMKLLLRYDWPGNVRELEDCLASAVAASSGPVLNIGDFPPQIRNIRPVSEASGATANGSKILPLAEVERQTILSTLERLNGDKMMTARALGIGKTTLYRKLKEYGLGEPWIARPISPR